MKKGSLVKGFLAALIIGVLFGAAFFLYFQHDRGNFIVSEQRPIAYHDRQENPDESILQEQTVTSGKLVGNLKIGDKTLGLTEKADYYLLKDNVSVVEGAKFGEPGLVYLYAFENNVKDSRNKSISVTVDTESYIYNYVAVYELNNETEVELQNYGIANGIVLYYQKTSEYGLQDKYEAMVFEEVK